MKISISFSNLIRPGIPAIALGALLLTGCRPTTDVGEESTAGSDQPSGITLTQPQMEMAGIEVGLPQKRLVRSYLECTGQLDVPPQNKASVHTPIQGFIRQVNYLEGDYVRKGTVLAVLSHPDLIRLQREFLESKGRLSFLKQEKERKESLAADDALAQKEAAKATSDYEIEWAHYKGIRAELNMIGLNVDALEKESAVQETLLLRAPVNGHITGIYTQLGELVQPGDRLYEMVDPGHIHLELAVFAKDALQVRPGQAIECWVPGLEKHYQAEVHLVGREIDPETKTVRVHGHFEKEPTHLLPGTYVQALITTFADSLWAIPQSALVREDGSSVLYVRKGDHFEPMPVQTGRQDGEYVEVNLTPELQTQPMVLKGAYYVKGVAATEED